MPHATLPSRPQYLRTLSAMIQRDKQRLYVALYPRNSAYSSGGSCDAYHWTLIVGPQTASRKDKGTRFHTAHASSTSRFSRKGSIHTFAYEENELPSTVSADTILVRVAVAKVLDMEVLEEVLRSIPTPQESEGENCCSWVRRAFEALHEEPGCLKSYLRPGDWKDVERTAREFCKIKRRRMRPADAEQLQMLDSISTWNFWEDRETAV